MITEPDRWAPRVTPRPAPGNVTIHAEAAQAPVRTPAAPSGRPGARRGGPGAQTPAPRWSTSRTWLPEIDMLLLMTVEPGFGGQPFLEIVLPKLRRGPAR